MYSSIVNSLTVVARQRGSFANQIITAIASLAIPPSLSPSQHSSVQHTLKNALMAIYRYVLPLHCCVVLHCVVVVVACNSSYILNRSLPIHRQ